jgi:mono/diheme cytochrome c family protein
MIPNVVIEKLKAFQPAWSPTLYKGALVTVFLLAFAIPLALVATPFIEFLNGMAAQPKGRTQMTYGRRDGKELLVERPPVAGTIPRGYLPYEFDAYGNKIEDAVKVGDSLKNPLKLTLENMKAGQKRYEIFCIVCHGDKGNGDGPVIGAERFPAPPSLHTKQARGYMDGTLFHIITKGINKMPGYGDSLTHEERWQVVQYVRALQRSMNPKPEDQAK